MKKLMILLFLGAICACKNQDGKTVVKKLTVSSLFTDHMVLQQQDLVSVWGEYTTNKKITISASWGATQETKADSLGKWHTKLQTPKAGGPHSIKIQSSDGEIEIQDVAIGEVWLASGQSNMYMPLKGWPNESVNNSENVIAKAKNPNIRFFKVPYGLSTTPQDSIVGKWLVSSPTTAEDFSATAYFFAKKLQEALNVPIGIIQSAVNGTPAEAWTSKNGLRELGDFNTIMDEMSGIESKTKAWFKDFKKQSIPQTEAEWKSLSFNDESLANFDYDDSNWSHTMTIPSRFDLINNKEFDGAVWLRKTFVIDNLNDIPDDNTLIIGGVDDMDATYINGKYVGGLVGVGYHHTLREFAVSKAILKEGKNTIAIRAIDTGGPGEIIGPIQLKSKTKSWGIALEGQWKKKLIADIFNGQFITYDENTEMSGRPNLRNLNSQSPNVLYNAMIHPLVPYNIKGAIWYQGESNVGRAEQYKNLFPLMIKDWRKQWKSDFPFYFVQIAPFTYGGNEKNKSQQLRNVQRLALETEKTGMVVTLDIGDEFKIHPSEKETVGNRLANLALSNEYEKNLVASGPLFKNVDVEENRLIISFDNIGSGLMAGENGLINFEIAGADKNYKPANAKIVAEKVIVDNANISTPVYVRYAWSDKSTASLFNKEGLPASTFTSE
ncbi:sialate O-acetylesterase [Flavivirga sp. 57AJ16]|uniref:sialate O-acetylesterase n=1 Tax=Flavivirga sp. 57AJ16 TaxID=3025307 RepID=UPI0023651A9D|nr:sialate O-acetylesterase [Flavivirga sp. 57AJ16]MDD7888082.1 sialate O-acetylesterase [Flavivirga sp. 57AJ16]